MAAASQAFRQPAELVELRRQRPHELQEISGYVWHRKTVLGRGSFGKVYKGWSKKTFEEVAVKVIRKEHYVNDAKVRENIQREIEIQGKLGGCINVLRLHHQENTREGRVLITEKCDKDLQEYIKQSNGLGEAAVKDFLQQIAAGLKTMYERGIAHRDLKPGNILLKKDPITGRMIVKLADFGFARTYLSEDEKTRMIMTSLAGTPVFMAPEALECVFYQGMSYNEKVDLWSVGALLYNCLVGKPGFYATLNEILPILKRKGNAIAFQRSGGALTYIYELPPVVNTRLSKSFKTKMEELLQKLLVVDPNKRMNHQEFFDFVQHLASPFITVFHIGPGKQGNVETETFDNCRDLCKLVAKKFGMHLEGTVAIVESSEEVVQFNSEALPFTLKDKSVLFVIDEQSLESQQVPAFSSVALDHLKSVLLNPAEQQKLAWNKGLESLCENVLEDQKIWTDNQNKGWRCYRRRLEQSFDKVKNAGVKLAEMTIQYKTQVATVRESLDLDVEQLTQLDGMKHVKAEEIDKCRALFEEQSTKYMSELSVMSTKCQDSIRDSTEELQAAFRIDIQAAMAELKPLVAKLQTSQGDQAIETARAFAALSEKYFANHVKALHHKMRKLYLHHRGADFVNDQLPVLDGSLEDARKELLSVQHQWRQAIYPSLMEKVGVASSSSVDLLEKEEELKTVRKKVEELEAMNQKMQSKVDVASSSSVALLEKEEELKTVRKKVEELEAMNQKMRSKVKQRDLDNEEKETKYEKLLVEHEALKKQLSQNGVTNNDPSASFLASTYSFVDQSDITPSVVKATTTATCEDDTIIANGSEDGMTLGTTNGKEDFDLPSRSGSEEKDHSSGGFADSFDGLTSVIPKALNGVGTETGSAVDNLSTVPVSLGDLKMACQCMKLSADFYSSLAKLLRANKPESLLSTCSSATASAGDKGDTIDSSRIADQTVESLDALSKPWPQPHSYFSVSDVSYPEGTDIVAELRGLINLLQPLDLSLLHEAVKATGSKISIDSFNPDDYVVFWPTSEENVFQALTTLPDRKVFLSPASVSKLASKDKGAIYLGRLKKKLITHVAQEGNKYKMPVKSLYHTVQADLVKRIGGDM